MNYDIAYQAAQAGGMNSTESHEFATDQATRDAGLAKVADFLGEQNAKLERLLPKHTSGMLSVETCDAVVHVGNFEPNPCLALVKRAGPHRVFVAFVPTGSEAGGADAERLVKCWNEHDELVAALRDLYHLHDDDRAYQHPEMKAARAILERAE